jgi:hypothetical protein
VAEARADGRYVLDWDDGDSQDLIKAPDEVLFVDLSVGRQSD